MSEESDHMIDEKQRSAAWHCLSADDVLRRVGAKPEGLGRDEGCPPPERAGTKQTDPAKRRSAWRRLLAQFTNALIAALLGAMVVMVFIGEWLDAAVVGAVVVVNAVIGFVQEGRAQKVLEEVRKAIANKAMVLRNGAEERIEAEKLVAGDIVLLKSGDLVPADLRIIEAKGLEAQEAALTGESTSMAKSAEPVREGTALAERASMAYSGTMFGSAPLHFLDGMPAAVLAVLLFAIVEVEKWIWSPVVAFRHRLSGSTPQRYANSPTVRTRCRAA